MKKTHPLPERPKRAPRTCERGSATTPFLALAALASVLLLAAVGWYVLAPAPPSPSDSSLAQGPGHADDAERNRSGLTAAARDDDAPGPESEAARVGLNAERSDRSASDPSLEVGDRARKSARQGADSASEDDPEISIVRRDGSRSSAGRNPLVSGLASPSGAADPDTDSGRDGGAGGFQVGKVFEGTSMYEAGIRPGDRIVSVNGESVSNWEDVLPAMDRNAPGTDPVIEFERADGTRQSVSVGPPYCCLTDSRADLP